MQIISAGTSKQFEMSHNKHWLENTAPIINAFYHAFRMLDIALQVNDEDCFQNAIISEELAAVLCLYRLR
jgi:hypothetical protein